VSYPAEAGVPVGGPRFSRYVMLEVHYNNPDRIAGKQLFSDIYTHAAACRVGLPQQYKVSFTSDAVRCRAVP